MGLIYCTRMSMFSVTGVMSVPMLSSYQSAAMPQGVARWSTCGRPPRQPCMQPRTRPAQRCARPSAAPALHPRRTPENGGGGLSPAIFSCHAPVAPGRPCKDPARPSRSARIGATQHSGKGG